MTRRYEYALDDQAAWVETPDRWLGEHAERRDRAARQAEESGLTGMLSAFAQAVAILEDWSIPGLEGNPEKWDFRKLDLRLIPWVVEVALNDLLRCYQVPKNSLLPLRNGSKAAAGAEKAPGRSEMSE